MGKHVSFNEYQAAKSEIINGKEYREDTLNPNQYGCASKTYSTVDNGNFYEVYDPNTGITEFWSDKHPTSRYYDGRTREEIIDRYEGRLTEAAAEIEALKARVKSLRTPTGTNMTQEDYNRLAKCGETMTDAEAVLYINKEFGFEAARIEILHEAEIDETPEGARCIKLEKAPRPPVYSATDWNYIRFNVRTAPATWYYEMVNAQLYPVLI